MSAEDKARAQKKGRVTGVGGIFFKTSDPRKTKDWYGEHLGLVTDQYGSLFEFRQARQPEKPGFLQWSPFKQDTDYFAPSEKEFMINFRVQHIEELVEQLRAAGVTICDEIESFEYGKFVHVMDLDGNKIELWEPVDEVFAESHAGKTTC